MAELKTRALLERLLGNQGPGAGQPQPPGLPVAPPPAQVPQVNQALLLQQALQRQAITPQDTGFIPDPALPSPRPIDDPGMPRSDFRIGLPSPVVVPPPTPAPIPVSAPLAPPSEPFALTEQLAGRQAASDATRGSAIAATAPPTSSAVDPVFGSVDQGTIQGDGGDISLSDVAEFLKAPGSFGTVGGGSPAAAEPRGFEIDPAQLANDLRLSEAEVMTPEFGLAIVNEIVSGRVADKVDKSAGTGGGLAGVSSGRPSDGKRSSSSPFGAIKAPAPPKVQRISSPRVPSPRAINLGQSPIAALLAQLTGGGGGGGLRLQQAVGRRFSG